MTTSSERAGEAGRTAKLTRQQREMLVCARDKNGAVHYGGSWHRGGGAIFRMRDLLIRRGLLHDTHPWGITDAGRAALAAKDGR